MFFFFVVFFQAEDGIQALVRSRGLGDVYKRQVLADSALQRRLHGVDVVEALPGEAAFALSLIHI